MENKQKNARIRSCRIYSLLDLDPDAITPNATVRSRAEGGSFEEDSTGDPQR